MAHLGNVRGNFSVTFHVILAEIRISFVLGVVSPNIFLDVTSEPTPG